jgi:hypothetical protein
MCGIVGVFPLNKTDLQIDANMRRQIAFFIHNEILFETVARGKDATGVSAAFGPTFKPTEGVADHFWCALKQPVDTEDFFLNDGTQSKYSGQDDQANLERFMDVSTMIKRPLRHIIGHTRAKTVGSEFNPLNNHPILVGKIIGVHNGGVKNYKKIYDKHKNMTPLGEVDSEVIMQLLAENANDRALDEEDIKYVTERIVGPRAVIAYNREHPEKVIYFHDKDRPLELAYIEELGLAVICSERKFFHRAMHVYHRLSLSLKRTLPQLTVQWKNVPTDRGGVIDVTTPIEGDVKANDLFPLITTPSTKTEYTESSVVTSTHKTTNYNKNYTGGSNSNYTAPKKSSVHKETPVAELTDVSKYGYGKDDDNGYTPEVKAIVASASVMDDHDEEEDDNFDEDLNAIDAYSDKELIKAGIEYVMSSEGRRDEGLLINKHEKSYSKYLSKPLCEEDAREIVHQLYPEAFGEGYTVGFKAGVDEQIGLQSDDDAAVAAEVDDLKKEINHLTAENKALNKQLSDEMDKQKKAAAYIANMKAFVMGAVMVHNLARVEGTGTDAELVFSDALETFLNTARGFGKVNPDMVKDIFNERDLKTMATGMVSLSEAVSNQRGTPVTEAAAHNRNIKS